MDLLRNLRLLADPQYFPNGARHYQEACEHAADRIEEMELAAQNTKKAADAILGPMTAEIGRLLEEAPDYPINIEAASHTLTIPAKHFMALYRATDE